MLFANQFRDLPRRRTWWGKYHNSFKSFLLQVRRCQDFRVGPGQGRLQDFLIPKQVAGLASPFSAFLHSSKQSPPIFICSRDNRAPRALRLFKARIREESAPAEYLR